MTRGAGRLFAKTKSLVKIWGTSGRCRRGDINEANDVDRDRQCSAGYAITTQRCSLPIRHNVITN